MTARVAMRVRVILSDVIRKCGIVSANVSLVCLLLPI